jgi:hypothetical protein
LKLLISLHLAQGIAVSEIRTIAAHNRDIMNPIAPQSQQGTTQTRNPTKSAEKFATDRKD